VAQASTVAGRTGQKSEKALRFVARTTAAKIKRMTYRLSRPLQSALLIVGAVLLLSWAYHRYGGLGVAGALGALVMCALVYISRFIKVMRLVAQRPVGHVESAVMLHARLRRGMPLLRVLTMTGALGQALTEPGVEPELFRWTDESFACVDCEFVGGRVAHWTLRRPDAEVPDAAQ
jgi:hypothetical protein